MGLATICRYYPLLKGPFAPKPFCRESSCSAGVVTRHFCGDLVDPFGGNFVDQVNSL